MGLYSFGYLTNSMTPSNERATLPEFVVGGIGPTLLLPFLLGKARTQCCLFLRAIFLALFLGLQLVH